MNRKIGEVIEVMSDGIVKVKIDINVLIALIEEGVFEVIDGQIVRKKTNE